MAAIINTLSRFADQALDEGDYLMLAGVVLLTVAAAYLWAAIMEQRRALQERRKETCTYSGMRTGALKESLENIRKETRLSLRILGMFLSPIVWLFTRKADRTEDICDNALIVIVGIAVSAGLPLIGLLIHWLFTGEL